MKTQRYQYIFQVDVAFKTLHAELLKEEFLSLSDFNFFGQKKLKN